MRARQFIVEYNQQATAQRFGDRLLQTVMKDGSPEISNVYNYLHDLKKNHIELSPHQKTNVLISIMQAIESADPTKNKEYTVFLTKMYAQGGWGAKIEDLESKVKPALIKFHTLKLKKKIPSPRNDIMRYADLADFVAVVDEYPDPEEKQQTDKGQAQTVFENDKVRIVVPQDETAACYYGQGTRWCTAARASTNYFKTYSSNGPLYILLPKQPKHPGEKYQLHFHSEQFMDEEDRPVEDIIYLLEHRFGDLVPWFQEREPSMTNIVIFASDEQLQPPLDQIRELAMEHIWEIVSDWEINDDYWYEHLREKGYVYPEGHEEEGQIDWDKAYDADESYLSWNYDANDWFVTAKNAVEVTPVEARRLAEDAYKFGDEGLLVMKDLDVLVAASVRDAFERSRDGDGGLEEWMLSRIHMVQRDGQWQAKYFNLQQRQK